MSLLVLLMLLVVVVDNKGVDGNSVKDGVFIVMNDDGILVWWFLPL